MHNKVLEYIYQEFLQQLFNNRKEISCIQFIERISCKYNKNKDPNKIVEEATIEAQNLPTESN